MLEASWEAHATTLANASNETFISALTSFVRATNIDLAKPSRVVYARDTRPTGESLVKALEDGLAAFDAEGRDAGITSTPILHYLVRAINTKGTKDAYGEDTETGYYEKLSGAFRRLVVSRISRLYQRSSTQTPSSSQAGPGSSLSSWTVPMVLVQSSRRTSQNTLGRLYPYTFIIPLSSKKAH